MTNADKIKARTELEAFLTDYLNDFQISTGLVLDDIALDFEGVRVEVIDEN